MLLFHIVPQILREMRVRKYRNILAAFGIMWGTVAVVVLLALGHGFYQASQKKLRGLANGTLTFNPGTTSKPFAGTPVGTRISIKAADLDQLKRVFAKDIAALSPVYFNEAQVSYGPHVVKSTLQATAADYLKINQKQAASGGRFIDRLDIHTKRAVVFIGPEVKQSLFKSQDPLGKTLYLNHIPFTVIGVLPSTSDIGQWYANIVMIPYTTYLTLWGDENVSNFIILPKNIAQADTLQRAITRYLAARFHFDPKDEGALYVFNMRDFYRFFNWFFLSIQIFLGLCGAMTLGVGGVGIANAMFLMVAERTPEIGLRMALGARSGHIMFQFMLEALILVLSGGLFGFMISGMVILLLHYITLPQWLGAPTLSFTIFFTTLCILGLAALLAGYFPARRAANMEPVDALAF